jgi:AcrR family transcriptional regulator
MFNSQIRLGTKLGNLFHIVSKSVQLFEERGGRVAKRRDRRVQRTQQLLRNALFSLVQEKGFESLSVQEIIDRADVGRATFYAHFDNKEDLLLSGFEDLRTLLKERQRRALSHGTSVEERIFGFSHEMLTHVNEHRHLFQAMVGKSSGAMIQSVIHKLLVDLLRDDVKAMSTRKGDRSIPTEALVEFIAGGLFGMMNSWLRGKPRLSVEELNALFRRLAIPAVRSASP